MKKICILAYTDLSRDPRQLKQILLLREHYHITSVGTEPSGYEHRFIKYRERNLLKKIFDLILIFIRKYEFVTRNREYKILKAELQKENFDIIIIHGIKNIILGLEVAKNAKLLLDAHEYYPENFSDSWIWRNTIRNYNLYLCKNYLHRVNCIITVSQGIVNLYKEKYNIKNVELITNSANFVQLDPKPVDIKEIKIIHHGQCGSSRKLELMIEAAKYFNKNIHLYLMLIVSRGYNRYYKKLKKLAEGLKNVHFIEPVAHEMIIRSINKFDIGLFFIPPANQNLYYGLGNKFFEYIQARLMIVSGPSIEIMKYIDKYKIGKYTKTFNPYDLAQLVNKLTVEEINNFKIRINQVARELSFEVENKDRFQNIINNLLNNYQNE